MTEHVVSWLDKTSVGTQGVTRRSPNFIYELKKAHLYDDIHKRDCV